MKRRKPNGGDRVRKQDPAAAEIDPQAGEIRPANTIPVEMRGGPMGHQVELLVDGAAPKHISKAVIAAEAGGLVRLQTEQIKLVASVNTRVAEWEKKVFAHAAVRSDDQENPVTYIGSGPSTREALLDLIEQIPAEVLDQ